MRARTDRVHSYRVRIAMSGRVRKDFAASFLTGRFLVPSGIAILLIAIVVWLLRGR